MDDALRVYEQTRGSCLRYSGLKDVGATPQVLAELTRTAHDDGLEVMLEVVSTSTEDEMGSLRAAAEIGVDWVLGGTHAAEGVAILRGRGIKYCPFPGRVIGHPSELDGELDGELEEIAEQSGAAVDQDARVRGSRPRGRRVRPWQPNDATERRNRTTRRRRASRNRIAPRLVQPVPFLYPLAHRVWERSYVGTGVFLYDTLAATAPERQRMPRHRHLTRRGALTQAPCLRPDGLTRRGCPETPSSEPHWHHRPQKYHRRSPSS